MTWLYRSPGVSVGLSLRVPLQIVVRRGLHVAEQASKGSGEVAFRDKEKLGLLPLPLALCNRRRNLREGVPSGAGNADRQQHEHAGQH